MFFTSDCLRTRRSKAQIDQFRVHVQVQHAFWYISLPSLHDHDVKCFYVTFGGREFKLGRAVTYILWDQGRIQDFFRRGLHSSLALLPQQ